MTGSRQKSALKDRRSSPLDELLSALAEVYADADLAFSGWSCPASTECCRFGITGREPYVTSIELAAIERAIAALGGLRARKRARPSSVETPRRGASLPLAREERRCPMLTDGGKCAIYASRPLGCRTFYCDRASPGTRVRHREINALVRRVQEIAERHQADGDRGRPLVRALGKRLGG
jgi:uncharacterized protein